MDRPQLSKRIPQVKGLQCVICGIVYSLDDVIYTCPTCGEVGTLDVIFHAADTSTPRTANLWEEDRFLPLAADMPKPTQTIPLQIGGTPYYPAFERSDVRWHKRPFAIKDDGKNPTGSFKDRASAMVVHHALTMGAFTVATASTGNAAAALAGMCAANGQVQAVIFVPASAPQAKITQLLIYGAKVVLVDGVYDTAFDLCTAACQEFGWYNRSTGINPFTSEGKKTIAWEIAFSGDALPDVILVSAGDGSIIAGVYKGFSDLKALGWIDRIPRLIGVQAAGSDALAFAWENNLDSREMLPRPANTLADSISAGLPRDRAKALRAVRQSNGAYVRVTDDQILAAIPELAQRTGIFAEPAAAATFAGWQVALANGQLDPGERALLLLTGNGLKDINSAMKSVPQTLQPIPPNLDAVRKALGDFTT